MRTSEQASRALPAAALDQGCLLLSTPSSTPITRARPLCCPIGSLGKSTFPRGPGRDWLEQLSVKRASRKDAAGVLAPRSPERRRSNLTHKQDVGPPPNKPEGWGFRRATQPWGPTRVERAERRVGESLPHSLPPPPAHRCGCNTFPSMSVFPPL